MKIKDSIYGTFEVEEVLEELMLCEAVQRLKGVYQGGASYIVNPEWDVTRYDHSVGVMLLIRKLGGTLEEQIVGLLHDVSHTAFSHVVDAVFENAEEDYHEDIYENIIRDSTIPSILERHGYQSDELLFDIEQWTLLERSAPELCADRVDYTLRDMYTYGHITSEDIERFLNDLVIVEGCMYLRRIETAEWFVQTYYKEVIDFFMHPLNVYGYQQLSELLRHALHREALTVDDFMRQDHEVISLIRHSNDSFLLGMLDDLEKEIHVEENPNHYDFHRKNKVRQIDPSVLMGETLRPSSHLSAHIRQMNDEALARANTGSYIQVLNG